MDLNVHDALDCSTRQPLCPYKLLEALAGVDTAGVERGDTFAALDARAPKRVHAHHRHGPRSAYPKKVRDTFFDAAFTFGPSDIGAIGYMFDTILSILQERGIDVRFHMEVLRADENAFDAAFTAVMTSAR